jgi:hypothetical protein
MARRKSKDSKLPITEEIDFHYLLELMPPLHDEPGFECLPELFSIIGHERLILLCKYAGGETIKIPTIEQLASSIESLQWFYDVYITGKKQLCEVPDDLRSQVSQIYEVYEDEIGDDQTGDF